MNTLAVWPSALPMEQCYPVNDKFTGPFGGLIFEISGAFGGLIVPLGMMVIVISVLLYLATVLTDKAPNYLKGIAKVVGALVILPVGLLALNTIIVMFQNACTRSLF